MASASRDQTVRVFDIRAMKELRLLKGHKKEVCCTFTSILLRAHSHYLHTAVAWHPFHPMLVSGGSEGAILHWDLSSSAEPNSLQPTSQFQPGPRATLSQAHDSNVWALTYHPLGHILVSASNDHTTRFWCRERPGDASSVFSGGGEKPPEVTDTSGQDEDEEAMVPGFGGGGWWGKEEDSQAQAALPHLSSSGPGAPVPMDTSDDLPGLGGFDGGGSSGSNLGRQSGPLPSQEDMFGHGGPEGDSHESRGPRGRRWRGGGSGGGGGGGGYSSGYGGGGRRGRH